MSDMVNYNNQAGRLFKILTLATQQPDNISIFQVWSKVFNVDIKDKIAIFKMLIAIQEIADDIKLKIPKINGVNSKLLLSLHSKIDTVVKATNLDATWANYKPQLDSAVMLNLAHCAEALSLYDEKPVDEDELKGLVTDITDLFNKVMDGNIDQELRAIILDLLEAIRMSIAEYKIRGANGIRDQLAYCLGKIYQHKDLFRENQDSEEISLWWKIFARADILTSVSLNFHQICQSVIKLIG